MVSHLALIMDGNRRWAKKRGMFPWLGHQQGSKSVEMVLKYCLEKSIPIVSLYTFSLENFKRSEQEISHLFSLIREVKKRVHEFVEQNIRIRFVGDKNYFPEDCFKDCLFIEKETKNGANLLCNFLFCYGGQQEIFSAVQDVLKANNQNITMNEFKEYFWLGNIAEPDIIIRTGGVKRLSNFLLFQAAYSEIRFLDCLWPDLTKKMLDETVQDCLFAQKNIGA